MGCDRRPKEQYHVTLIETFARKSFAKTIGRFCKRFCAVESECPLSAKKQAFLSSTKFWLKCKADVFLTK